MVLTRLQAKQANKQTNKQMVLTRLQAKQQQQQQQQKQQQPQQQQPQHKINFIEASTEWRKNKIKRENCTFEYIFI